MHLRLATAGGDGTGNVCKTQVAPFPTFESIGIRNNKPCGPTTPYYTYVVGEDATQRTVRRLLKLKPLLLLLYRRF